jgi:hypothetical protein
MSKLKQAMHATIDFLESEFRIKNIVFVPFPIMLVPLVRFFASTLKPSADQRKSLRRWFWHCAFTQRYKAGTNRLVMEDLSRMMDLASGKPAFDKLASIVDASTFQKTWRINSTVAKAAICLLAQLEPKSFLSGAPVDLSDALSAYNAREFHHIYPKAYLQTQGIHFHEANIVANICMLTSSDNKEISDSNPVDYFPKIPATIRDDVFDRALVPPAFRNGSRLYADFVKARSEHLAQKAGELIQAG